MKKAFCFVILLFPSGHGLAASNDLDLPKRKYFDTAAKENHSWSMQRVLERNPGISGKELEVKTNMFSMDAANCQLISIDSYPKKYSEVAFSEVLAGKRIGAANKAMGQSIDNDVRLGKLSIAERNAFYNAAKEIYMGCIKKI